MAAETPSVSVIVPVYDVRGYLRKCVRSIQNQTERDIEIILVDDGSTDGSGKLCDRLAARDSRIVVCHQKNSGVSAARNRGLDLARGKYIMFCDSDDTALPRYCQAHLEAMSQPGVALTINGAHLTLPAGPAGEKYFPSYQRVMSLLLGGWLTYVWGKCYETQKLRIWGLRFDRQVSYGEDTIFVMQYALRLLDQPGQICLWQEPLYEHYKKPGSLSQNMKAKLSTVEPRIQLARQLNDAVGLDGQELELERYVVRDRVILRHEVFQACLNDCPWYRLRRGLRLVKEAMAQPDFQDMVQEGTDLAIFHPNYWKLLRERRAVPLFLRLTLRKMAKQVLRNPLVQRVVRRRICI